MASRNGSAVWKGNLKEGSGELTVGDGVLNSAYSFRSRFEEGDGTNPEELIAAAHAACFSMALSHMLAEAGHTPDSVSTSAKVELRPVDGKPTIASIALTVEGAVPGIDAAQFQDLAEGARGGCAVSRALAGVPEITLEARLV